MPCLCVLAPVLARSKASTVQLALSEADRQAAVKARFHTSLAHPWLAVDRNDGTVRSTVRAAQQRMMAALDSCTAGCRSGAAHTSKWHGATLRSRQSAYAAAAVLCLR